MKVRYYSHGGSAKTGYAKAALDLAMALQRTPGVELELRPLGPPASVEFPDAYLPLATSVRRDHELSASPDVVLVHTLPLDCARVLEVAKIPPGPKLIAYTTWETLMAPLAVRDSLGGFDQLWTPSMASLCAFAGVRSRGSVLPHCFDVDTLAARRGGERREGPFRFYWIGAWTVRKNPVGLIRAFAHAFTKKDDVELVIHSPGIRPEDLALALASTGVPQEEMASIGVSPSWVPEETVIRTHAQSDCFVTAAHGEAWNLPAFEAMLAGRMIIAPMGHGSDEFLLGTDAVRYGAGNPSPASIDARITANAGTRYSIEARAPQGVSARSVWQEPDLVELALRMQNVAFMRTRDLVIDYDPSERYGYSAVGHRAVALMNGELETP